MGIAQRSPRLEKHGLPVHVIHGNNTGDMFTLGRLAALDKALERQPLALTGS